MCRAIALVVALFLLAPYWSPATALECNFYSAQPTIDLCVKHSKTSPRAKREGFSDAGIRRWCEQNQPTCSKRKGAVCEGSCSGAHAACVKQGVDAGACGGAKSSCLSTGVWIKPLSGEPVRNRCKR
jgi:hypothetical protein